jgi:4-alpha-glucanotransferase
MAFKRSSGILMHISSLPGKYGIGDLGKSAYQWVNFLHKTGTGLWQVLPLNPTGYGDSPYQGLSAFAGNPLFIDLDDLKKLGLVKAQDLAAAPNFPISTVAFNRVRRWKRGVLELAFTNFKRSKKSVLKKEFEQFKLDANYWLEDFSVFMALREQFKLVSWSDWPDPYRLRDPQALLDFTETHNREIEMHAFFQFLFFKQWFQLKQYANDKGIQIIGDIPIFMGFDSADVWANPHLFKMDKDRRPTFVAGVPPDFFSKTGQLWGNPVYEWKEHRKEGYDWWIKRVAGTLKTVDIIRLDHFRGFAGYYQIPASAKTAEFGKWVKGPDKNLFDAIENKLGKLPFIAEDLGVITPDVIKLRERYNLPGMRLFQFAFGGDADDPFLPHTYPVNCVAYTGTHDNDTTKSWFKLAPKPEQRFSHSYLGYPPKNAITHSMIRGIWACVAVFAIAPMQDFLQLGNSARMNLPATTKGNWRWRMKPDAITDTLTQWLKELNITYGRVSTNQNWKAGNYFKG